MRSRQFSRPPYDAALPTLRRRTVRLTACLSRKSRAFIRLAPLLLHARFRRPSFDTDPPGLIQPPRRRRWGRLCEQLDLPPPMSYSQHRPLVTGVVLAPTPNCTFEFLVIPIAGLSPGELRRVTMRVEALRQLAARHAPDINVRTAEPAELTPSLFAWAAVIAGDLPALPDSSTLDWHDAFARAPTPLLRCLMLLVRPDAAAPLTLMRTSHIPTEALDFVACWSATAVARDVAALEGKSLSPAELDGLVHQFRAACVKALRAFPLKERKALRATIRPALLGSRIPPVFRAHLERALAAYQVREVQYEQGWQLELDGLVLARARSLDQLRASALIESPRLAHPGVFWQRLSAVIQSRVPRALVLVEPGFLRHLVVLVPRSGRARAQRVDASGALQFLLTWHRSGVPVELIPSPGCDPVLVARASQLLATSLRADETIGIQLGKKMLLFAPKRIRVLPLARAFCRPRLLTWLPEQADLKGALRKPLATKPPTIQVVAFPEDERCAALYAIDAQGALFRELVPLVDLEVTLQEFRTILKNASPAALLAASVHPSLASLGGRRTEEQPPTHLTVVLTEHGDQAILDGETFGAGAPLPWSALAEAVLSRWPPGTWAHVSVDTVKASADTSALTLLAGRGRVLRRLNTHLHRISRLLRAA